MRANSLSSRLRAVRDAEVDSLIDWRKSAHTDWMGAWMAEKNELDFVTYRSRVAGIPTQTQRTYGPRSGPNPAAERALEIALDTRKFEIDLYWRRATYFWLILTAIFVGFFAADLQAGIQSETLLVRTVLAFLGCVFAWAWFAVNRGSKFWQQNWEKHVDLLETEVYGKLFQTVIDTRGECSISQFLTGPAAWSVSKINQITSFIVFAVFVGLFLKTLMEWFGGTPWAGHNGIIGGAFIAGAIAIMLLFCWLQRSSLEDGDKNNTSPDSGRNRLFRLKF